MSDNIKAVKENPMLAGLFEFTCVCNKHSHNEEASKLNKRDKKKQNLTELVMDIKCDEKGCNGKVTSIFVKMNKGPTEAV